MNDDTPASAWGGEDVPFMMKTKNRFAVSICLLIIAGAVRADEFHSIKKGVGSGKAAKIHALNCSWYYNWGIGTASGIDSGVEYVPMRHNRWWQNLNKLAEIGEFDYFLGYNEPERADQGDITVAQAINQWPQLEAAADQYGALLGSPATANPMHSWITNFMAQAEALNYRVDFMAMHKYPTPQSSGSILNGAQALHDAYNRDVWITEFNAADWSAPNNYTHAQSYTWMVEVLYRLETTDYIKRYAIFPWDGSSSASAASAVFNPGTDDLTPLGKLYAGYRSSDVNGPYANTLYYLHNHNTKGRVDHLFSAGATNIYKEGATADFKLSPAGGGQWYIVNQKSALRLGSDGTNLFWSYASDDSVKWSLTDGTYCWKFIDHVGSGMRLATTGDELSLSAGDQTGWEVQWVFIRSDSSVPGTGMVWEEDFSTAPVINTDGEPHFESEWGPGQWLAISVNDTKGAFYTNGALRMCSFKNDPTKGHTQVYGYVLDETLFSEGAGDYEFSFDITARSHGSARLGVKVYEVTSGGGSNAYYWASRLYDRGVEGSITHSGTATATALSTNNIFWGTSGNIVKFSYDGDGDVALLFSAMSNNQWLNSGLFSEVDNLSVYRVVSDFESWGSTFGLGYAELSSTVDSDFDGYNNLLEYAQAGNPTNASEHGILPSLGAVSDAELPDGVEFIHIERAALDHGLLYTLECKTELERPVWTNVTDAVLLGEGLIDGGYKAVTNKIPTTGKTTEFLRLRVETTVN